MAPKSPSLSLSTAQNAIREFLMKEKSLKPKKPPKRLVKKHLLLRSKRRLKIRNRPNSSKHQLRQSKSKLRNHHINHMNLIRKLMMNGRNGKKTLNRRVNNKRLNKRKESNIGKDKKSMKSSNKKNIMGENNNM